VKKILLISYYFNPCRAIGSKRWSEFFTLFDEDVDFEITVLTANWMGSKLKNKNIIYIGDIINFKPFESINKEFTFLDKIKHPSIYFRSLDKNMFSDKWYDNAKIWIENNKNNEYDIVISSYTPINAIRLGNYAKDIYKARLIVDMRDMMSIQGQKLKLPIVNLVDNLIDKFWLRKANDILSVGPTICKKASSFYNKNVHLIYNAFLEKNFTYKEFKIQNKNKIVFSYLGTMGIKRNPRGLIKIINKFCKESHNVEIEMNFASQDNPNEFIENLDINSVKINWLGYINKQEVAELKEKTDCFILLEDMHENGKENVTGKIFEYMLEQKPVIAYCHPNSDVKDILSDSGIGKIVTSNIEFKSFISVIINDNFKLKEEKILEFSRENQYNLVKGIL
jgi:glycosyltransferase involved in cell wall biosynthesis